MKIDVIVHELAQKVIDTIYDEWHHEGHIEFEQSDKFCCKIDGQTYVIFVQEENEK